MRDVLIEKCMKYERIIVWGYGKLGKLVHRFLLTGGGNS